ncbi:hypothetical protein A5883_000172 [Enterococcus sp. 5B3_DIV0040]|nr:hypothetical protein A5883_000172 [Enterococcus sp. 5B3_DIV0040]
MELYCFKQDVSAVFQLELQVTEQDKSKIF